MDIIEMKKDGGDTNGRKRIRDWNRPWYYEF